MIQPVFVETAGDVLDETVQQVLAVAPRVLNGALFLAVAYVAIKIATAALSRAAYRALPRKERLVAELSVLVAGVFMWFGAGLAFLHVVGMKRVAASLGTATGFVALGVAYAMSETIADTVAGVYLLKDPDFEPGDHVDVDGTEGTVQAIDLRKTRLENPEGETVVLPNSDVDGGWRLLERGHGE